MSDLEYDDEPGTDDESAAGFEVVPFEEDDYLPVIQPRPTRVTVTNVVDTRVIPTKADVAIWVDQTLNGIVYRKHKWGVHTMRVPLYIGRLLRSFPRGLWFLLIWWRELAFDREGLQQRMNVLSDNSKGPIAQDSAYAKADERHRNRVFWRAIVATPVAIAVAAILARAALLRYPPWLCVLAVLAVLCAIGWYGAAPGTIITLEDAPRAGVRTGEEVAQAFMAAAITTPVNTAGRGTGPVKIMPPGPRNAGTGWTVSVELPPGVTSAKVSSNLPELASGLNVAEDCLELDPLPRERAPLIELWVADVHPAEQQVPPSPLLDVDRRSVFRPYTCGWGSRGQDVNLTIAFRHTLVGAVPRVGKTTVMRGTAIATVLDPNSDMIVVDFGGGLDYLALKPYCIEFVHGGQPEHVLRFRELIAELKAEHYRRMATLVRVGTKVAPDNRITERLAATQMRPIVVIVDEFQIATTDAKKLGEEIVEEWASLMKICAKTGIWFVMATQDARSAPPEMRNIALQRIALTVAQWQASMAILGNDAQSRGLDASRLDGIEGYGIVWGVDSEFGPGFKGRAKFANISASDLDGILERVTRPRPGDVHEERVEVSIADTSDVPPLLLKALEVWPHGTDRIHLSVLAGLLGIDDTQLLGKMLRQVKVPIQKNCKVRIDGDVVNATGVLLSDVEDLAGVTR